MGACSPFLYIFQYVTYKFVQRTIFCLWTTGAALTCLPFLGFGLYYNQDCLRYRDATEIKDIAYAYIFFTFGNLFLIIIRKKCNDLFCLCTGTLLCISIVWCNLGVMKELIRIGSRKRTLVRRFSRSTSQSGNELIEQQSNPTPEELAFAKLMAILCISFVICWMPQMVRLLYSYFNYIIVE